MEILGGQQSPQIRLEWHFSCEERLRCVFNIAKWQNSIRFLPSGRCNVLLPMPFAAIHDDKHFVEGSSVLDCKGLLKKHENKFANAIGTQVYGITYTWADQRQPKEENKNLAATVHGRITSSGRIVPCSVFPRSSSPRFSIIFDALLWPGSLSNLGRCCKNAMNPE